MLESSRRRVGEVGGVNDRYWIEEIDSTGLFEIPPRPTPRERFVVRVTEHPRPPGTWRRVAIDVLDGERAVGAYERNYAMLQTFEPFRQGDRNFALVSSNYTATSIMDLATGEIIGGEQPDSGGFCPVGFYVPDWWDVHDATILPGTTHWSTDKEWPVGDFGFVWGCVWGDDSSWKVQYLDLACAADGVVSRDERFGYLELASDPQRPPAEFIQVTKHSGDMRVRVSVLQEFDVGSGRRVDPDE